MDLNLESIRLLIQLSHDAQLREPDSPHLNKFRLNRLGMGPPGFEPESMAPEATSMPS